MREQENIVCVNKSREISTLSASVRHQKGVFYEHFAIIFIEGIHKPKDLHLSDKKFR